MPQVDVTDKEGAGDGPGEDQLFCFHESVCPSTPNADACVPRTKCRCASSARETVTGDGAVS
jgi:hypothetical protein